VRRGVLGTRRVCGVDHAQVLSQRRQTHSGAPAVHVGGVTYRLEHRVPGDEIHLRAIHLGHAPPRRDAVSQQGHLLTGGFARVICSLEHGKDACLEGGIAVPPWRRGVSSTRQRAL
jgi:hypothetical protein